MSKQNKNEVIDRAVAEMEDICYQYEEEFRGKIANPNAVLDGDRIQEIERLWHKVKQDSEEVIARLTETLIESLNEGEIIELKKAFMPGKE